MIKNEHLIRAMSIDDKIKLITGIDLYRNRVADGYDFPVFTWIENPLENAGVRVTDFPSDRALAATWNSGLVQSVYQCIANEAKASVPNAYYSIANAPTDTGSDATFVFAQFIADKIKGLHEGGVFVNYEDHALPTDSAEAIADYRLLNDAVFSQTDPDSVLCMHSDRANAYNESEFRQLKFGLANTKEDVARFLDAGYTFVFLATDFTEQLIPYLRDLTVEYRTALSACKSGKLTPEQLDVYCHALKMMSPARIDATCDCMIDLLIALSANGPQTVTEKPTAIDPSVTPLYDEPTHNAFALSAARESIVLLKNSNGLLPLKHEMRVAVIGEYAKDPFYTQTENTHTVTGLPFDVINDYEIQTVGFAYGYRRDEPGRSDLWTTAGKLCAQADVALVYLCSKDGTALPTEQLQLLNALYDRGVKTVAVVAADDTIDFSFVDKCSAVLFTDRGGQRVADAVFEIITGAVNPSGRLVRPIYKFRENEPDPSTVQYPLGYGLSYTSFSYTNLGLSDRGATLTVTNTGENDGYTTVQLYVQKKGAPDKILRGFQKVFIKKKDTVKVRISFGPETFRSYDVTKEKFCVAAGEYVVSIGENCDDVRLEGELTLAAYVFDEEKFGSRGVLYDDGERALKEFVDTTDKRAFYARNSGTAFGLKVTLAALLAVYCDVSAVLLLFGGMIPRNFIGYIAVGAALLIVNIGVLIFIVTAVVKRSRASKKLPEPMIGELVEKIGAFKELAHVSYQEPIAQDDAKTEEEEDESSPIETESEDIVRTYDTDFTVGTEEHIEFRENATLTELCNNFRDYGRSCGVEIEASSARALFAALAAGKLILVDIKNKDALPAFLLALEGYFGDVDAVDAMPSWSKPADLYWQTSGDKYIASGFVNALYAAAHTPDKNAVAIVNHVDVERLHDYFMPFIRHSLFPSEEQTCILNDTTSIVLPKNIHYILIAEDGFGTLPADVAAASIQIEPVISTIAPTEPVEIKPVSYSAFHDLVNEARETQFLPETVWKKVDDLIAAISANEPFGIGNKSILQLERLTAVLLECGADESEATVSLFTAKIVGRLKQLNLYKQPNGDRTLFGMIEKLFADENLTKIRKALINVGASDDGRK